MSAAVSGSLPEAPASDGPDETFVDALARLTPPRQHAALLGFLTSRIARRLHATPEEISPRAPLIALGLSSLEAVELKAELERELRLPFRSSILFDYPTLELLVPYLLERLRPGSGAARAAQPAASPARSPAPLDLPPADDDPAEQLRRLLAEE